MHVLSETQKKILRDQFCTKRLYVRTFLALNLATFCQTISSVTPFFWTCQIRTRLTTFIFSHSIDKLRIRNKLEDSKLKISMIYLFIYFYSLYGTFYIVVDSGLPGFIHIFMLTFNSDQVTLEKKDIYAIR